MLRKLAFIILTVGGASCISLIGGLGLEAVQDKILPIVPLLIALPGLNTMVGDYAATIAAHAGDPAERSTSKRTLAIAIAKVVWINILGVIILSLLLAARRGYLLEQIFLIKFVVFVIIAMLGIIGVMFAITIVLDKLLEKKHLNPDDVLIPIVTTISDIFMLGIVALATLTLF